MSKKKEKREKHKKMADKVKGWMDKNRGGFESPALKLPEGATLFKPKADKPARIDIIPYMVGEGNPNSDKGELHFERTYYVHKNVGIKNASYVCLQATCNKPCPICEYQTKLRQSEDADPDVIKSLWPQKRQLFNMIDLDSKDKKVQLWETAYNNFGKALRSKLENADEGDGWENFAELAEGLTLKIGFEEVSFGKNSKTYVAVETIDFKARKEQYEEDILESTFCLDDIVNLFEYDELKKIFLQAADKDEEADEEEEEETPKAKKGKKAPAKKKADEDEDNDEDEDGDDEDDDEDDDDDDDEDDDDEPVKKGKKAPAKKTTAKKTTKRGKK